MRYGYARVSTSKQDYARLMGGCCAKAPDIMIAGTVTHAMARTFIIGFPPGYGLAMHPDAVMTYDDALITVHHFPAGLD